MSVKRRISTIMSPVMILGLKVYTKVTGTPRARMLVWNEKGEILLVLGFVGESWSLPGGGVKRGEMPIDAAIRELYEETGIRVTRDAVSLITVADDTQSHVGYTAYIYQTAVQSSDVPSKLHNPYEIIELLWSAPANLPEPHSPLVSYGLDALSKK